MRPRRAIPCVRRSGRHSTLPQFPLSLTKCNDRPERSPMLDRRDFLRLGVTTALAGLTSRPASAAPAKLLFVHGRDQQGKDPVRLKAEWLDALTQGAKKLNRTLPANLDVAFPFYGDVLDGFAKAADIPLSVDV